MDTAYFVDYDTWDIDNAIFALKVESPPCSWEFYICNKVQQLAAPYMLPKYPKIHSQHVYSDMSFLLMDFGQKGTLQDVINAYL
jgi:checkpoint serine/threonine-protein kinase